MGRLTAAAIWLASGGVALAQQPAPPQGAASEAAQPGAPESGGYSDGAVSAHLLGNFGGARDRLHDSGLDLRANVVSELAGDVSGGRSQALRAASEFNFGADADLGRLGIDDGGQVHATFTQRWGRSLSRDSIGNLVSVQEIYGTGEDFRLTELSFEQAFAGDHVNVSLGRVITENDFAASPTLWDHAALYCVFQNNGVCGTPVGVPVNAGYDAYPQSTWGGRVRIAPTDATLVQFGAYEVNPTLGASSNGLKIGANGDTGAFLPLEFGWRPGHALSGAPSDDPGVLPGDYRVGVYYDTSHGRDPFANVPGKGLPAPVLRSYTGKYGLYATAARTVWRAAGGKDGDPRGLSVFAALNLGDAATSLYRVYAEAGAVLKGTFAGRDDDTAGFAVTDTEVNSRRRDYEALLLAQGYAVTGKQVREVAFEADYGAAVFQGVNLEPNVQLILHPGAVSEVPHAWVLGLRTSVKF